MKYQVYGLFTGTKYLGEIEANSPEEAEDMAAQSNANYVSLCHECSREVEIDDHSAHTFIVEELP